jgi:PD-(D/E)XK nuclease superfamily
MTQAAPIKQEVSIGKVEVVKNIQLDVDLSKALIVDAHLLKTYRACEQKFYWFEEAHIIGKGRSPAPGFGIAMHSAIEHFRKAKKLGMNFSRSLDAGKAALIASYQANMPPENQQEVMQDDKRSLPNAIRIFDGYCKHYEPFLYSFLYVEIPFALYIGQIDSAVSKGRKDVVYVGIIDAVLEHRGRVYVNDLKTTAWTLNESWLEGFRMDQGLIGYTIAARELLGVDTQYALVHGIWVQKEPKSDKAKKIDEYFKSKEIYWDEEQLKEWHRNTLKTAERIERSRASNDWQMDYGQNCSAFGGCSYRPLCSAPLGFRHRMIELDYELAFWAPLEDERLQKLAPLEL